MAGVRLKFLLRVSQTHLRLAASGAPSPLKRGIDTPRMRAIPPRNDTLNIIFADSLTTTPAASCISRLLRIRAAGARNCKWAPLARLVPYPPAAPGRVFRELLQLAPLPDPCRLAIGG